MTTTLNENEFDLDNMPFEHDLMFGKRYAREQLTGMNLTYQDYFNSWYTLLKNIAMSTIKWSNIPAGIDTRAMEYILVHFGCAALFTQSGGFLFGQASFADQVNMYYNPNKVLISTPSGQWWYRHAQHYTDSADVVHMPDCVLVWDNQMRRPLLWTLRRYAKRLAQIDLIIDSNMDAQLTPWVIAAGAEGRKQADKMKAKLKRRDQFWEVTQAGAELAPYVLQTGAPFVAENLAKVRQIVVNDALTFMGVDNSLIDKKERVQTAEVLSNNEMIMAARAARLRPRMEFCRKAHEVFGLDLQVEWGIEGSMADIAATLTGGGLASIQEVQQMGGVA